MAAWSEGLSQGWPWATWPDCSLSSHPPSPIYDAQGQWEDLIIQITHGANTMCYPLGIHLLFKGHSFLMVGFQALCRGMKEMALTYRTLWTQDPLNDPSQIHPH